MARGDNELYTILYVSRAIMNFDRYELNALLDKAKKNNNKRNITGILLYSSKCFIQVLEGKKEDVQQLFNKIGNDSRHFDLRVLIEKPVSQRLFEKWSMAHNKLHAEEVENDIGLSGLQDLDQSVIISNEQACEIHQTLTRFKQNPLLFFNQAV